MHTWSKSGISICWRDLVTLKESSHPIFSSEKDLVYIIHAQREMRKPSNIDTMQQTNVTDWFQAYMLIHCIVCLKSSKYLRYSLELKLIEIEKKVRQLKIVKGYWVLQNPDPTLRKTRIRAFSKTRSGSRYVHRIRIHNPAWNFSHPWTNLSFFLYFARPN